MKQSMRGLVTALTCCMLAACASSSPQRTGSITMAQMESFVASYDDIVEYLYHNDFLRSAVWQRMNDDVYSSAMVVYLEALESVILSMTENGEVSEEGFDLLVEWYLEAVAFEPPKEAADMYRSAGLGRDGHRVFTKIVSIFWYWGLDENIDDLSPQECEVVAQGLSRLKTMVTQEDWNTAVDYFNDVFKDL